MGREWWSIIPSGVPDSNENVNGSPSYLQLGVDWQANNASDTTYQVAPLIYRWDRWNTDNSGGYYYEVLSPDANNNMQSQTWGPLYYGSGSGTRHIDSFGTRTYQKKAAPYTVTLTINWKNTGSAYDGYYHGISDGWHDWVITIPALPTYKITLNNQSATTAGTTSVNVQYGATTITSGTTTAISSLPKKTGYTFGGYYTSSNGAGTQRINASGKWVNTTNTTFTGNTTLYAKWIPTVTVNISGTTTWGQTLTATATTVSPGTKTYQWYYTTTKGATSGTNISGATSSTYKVPYNYVGKYIGCKVSVEAATGGYLASSGANTTAATIGKINPTIYIYTTSSGTTAAGNRTITYPATTDTVYAYSNNTGAITVSSGNTSAVTVALSGTTSSTKTDARAIITSTAKAYASSSTITVNVAADTYYNAGSKTFVVTTKKANNPMSFATTESKTISYGATTCSITAAASAQGSVTYSLVSAKNGSTEITGVSVNSSTGEISGLPTVNVGSTFEIVIKASAAGNSNYNANTINKTVSIVVSKLANPIAVTASQSGSATYSASAQSKSFAAATGAQGAVTYSISAKDSSGSSVSNFTMPTTSTASFNIAAGTAVGTYTLTITATAAGGTNYNSGSKTITYTLTITALSLTIPTVNANPTYNGTTSVSPTWSDYNSTYMTIGGTTSNAGATTCGSGTTYTATFTLNNTTNTKWSDNTTAAKSISWYINKRSIIVTADSATKTTYDGSAVTKNSGSITTGSLGTGDMVTITATGSQTNVGSSNNVPNIVIKNSAGSDVTSGCYSILKINGTLKVTNKANDSISITLAPGWTYDNTSKRTVTALSSSSNTGYFAIGTSSTTAPTSGWTATLDDSKKINAGTYYVWYKTNGNTNYNAISPTYKGSVTISKAALSGSVKITGNNVVGETLTASVTNNNSATLSYQWYYNTANSASGGTAISGATGSTYTIPKKVGTVSLIGKYIYVDVTASKDNYNNAAWSDTTDETNNKYTAVACFDLLFYGDDGKPRQNIVYAYDSAGNLHEVTIYGYNSSGALKNSVFWGR